MTNMILTLPLLLILGSVAGAALAGWPALNRRVNVARLGWALALGPLAAFGVLLWLTPAALADGPLVVEWRWLPAFGLSLGLYYDGLSALFALLVSGIGALVTVYAGAYFAGDRSAWRFFAYLHLFMFAMLGLVLAGDLILLFIFWEGTSIVSFLLVSYKSNYAAARQGALKALLITGGGGIALLAGFLIVTAVAGGSSFSVLFASGEALRASPLYPLMFGLAALGALTKSAQTPFHIWLPEAMSAPTPASAFLHSATMVKAGIYLLARLNPALGQTELWFWTLSLVGLLTMLTGAYLGLKQNDLKALLAYSTISQLGVLVLLIGQDTDIAFKALAIGVLAHALYKSALFMVAGNIDRHTGTRDLRRLGGLLRRMPAGALAAGVAALSMAGLPPLFGFLAKETLLATAVHPTLPPGVAFIFPLAAVIAGALLLAQAGVLFVGTFLGARPSGETADLEPETRLSLGGWAVPLIPAGLSLAIGGLPEPQPLAALLAGAASAAYGGPVKVSLALWTGLNVPLLLSGVAISLGGMLFWQRARVRAWQSAFAPAWSLNRAYQGFIAAVDGGARAVTRVQNGRLRSYLAAIFTGVGVLLLAFNALPPALGALSWPQATTGGALAGLRLVILLFATAAAVASVFLRRDLLAILAISAVGLGIAILIALEPAPDVALVQVVVDILATVVLVLTLTRLPRAQRQRASLYTFLQSPAGLARDAVIAVGVGLVISLITFTAFSTRPRTSLATQFYEANAKPLTNAQDIVGAVVVDFRAFDTLVEIAVFGVAGLGIYSLLRYAVPSARRKQGGNQGGAGAPAPARRRILGIAGLPTSPFLHALAYASLPLALTLAAIQIAYGHDQPGDGFTAGVIVSLALAFWYVIFGYDVTKAKLRWLRPRDFIGAGLLLALLNGALAGVVSGAFLAHVDYGALLGFTLPAGFSLSSALFFELAIALTVLGSAVTMLDTLGHPQDQDEESARQLAEIQAERRENGAPAEARLPRPAQPALEEKG